MAINQLIAAGIQPPRFESPYNMMAQFAQIQQAQQANALNQMRMRQMEQEAALDAALMRIPVEQLRADPFAAISVGGRRAMPLIESLRKSQEAEQNAALARAKFEDVQSQRVAPKPTEVRLGNRTVLVDTNPNSPTYNQIIREEQIGAAPESESLLAQRRAAAAASEAAGEASRARQAEIGFRMGAAQRAESAPKPTQVQLGNRIAFVDLNPLSPTYNQEVSSLDVGARPLSDVERQRAEAAIAASQAAAGTSQARARQIEAQMSTAQQLETAPKPMQANLGNQIVFFDMNPRSPTFGQRMVEGQVGARPSAPSELTRLIAERDRLPPGDPNRAAYDARIEALGRVGGTTVNVGAGEREEEKARGAGLAKEEETVSTLAQSARRQLTSIDSAQRVLDAGFRTGFGTDVKAKAANFLAAMGVKDAGKFATNAQTFLQAIKENVLAKQLEQKGVQTNQDAERIEQTFAQLGNTPEANQFMLDVARAQAKRLIEQDQFYRKWIAENKTMRGARDAWFETEGDKSLFERPELQRYAPQQRGAVGDESGGRLPSLSDIEAELKRRGGR